MVAKYDLLVTGGGAAGFFGAINAAAHKPMKIAIVEKTGKWLSKVKVSGGGRCNVTHDARYVSQLVKNYPRGEKFLKKVFEQFNAQDTVRWFESQGIPLKKEVDGRMFPVTDSSQTVIDLFLRLAKRHRIELIDHFAVTEILRNADGSFEVRSEKTSLSARKVLVTVGGQPKAEGFSWLTKLGHAIEYPVPSLFTFNVPRNGLRHLAGISVPMGGVRLPGLGLSAVGPLLITHWGFSGPAILRLSAWGARKLAEAGYAAPFLVNWLGEQGEEETRKGLEEFGAAHPKKVVASNPLYSLPARLWTELVQRAGISEDSLWLALSKKDKNRLLEMLIRCPFEMNGKTTFKEEFVTCGGLRLEEVNPLTMESRIVPGLYFAGEVLDIDGITGGFNFQSAWSGAWVAAQAIAAS